MAAKNTTPALIKTARTALNKVHDPIGTLEATVIQGSIIDVVPSDEFVRALEEAETALRNLRERITQKQN